MKKNSNNKKGTSLPLIIFILISALVGACFGFIISYKLSNDLTAVQFILRLAETMLIFFIVMFVHIIIHEAGHLIAGLMRGYRFLSFLMLNVMITRKDGKFRFSRYSIPGAGGQCLMVPPAEGDTDAGIAFYNAGGIITNAVTGLVSGVILMLFYDSMSFEATIFLMSFAIIGIIFAIQNGVPMTMGGLPNDGRNMKELKKDKFSTQVFLDTMRITAAMQQGDDIEKLMPEYKCDGRQLDLSNPIHAMALNFDLYASLVKMDFAKSCEIIDRALESSDKLVGLYYKEFKLEQIFMSLVHPAYSHDVEKLLDKDILNYMNKMSAVRPDVLRISYTVALLHEHDEKKAEKIYERFKKMCKNYHSLSEVRYQTRLVDMVGDIYEKQKERIG